MTEEMKPLSNDLIDALLADYKKPEDLIGQNGLLKQLTKALVEQALQGDLHDLRHRVRQHEFAQNHQDPRFVSNG